MYAWNYEEDFFVPEEVKAHFEELKQRGSETEQQWNELFNSYKEAYPALANELEKAIIRKRKCICTCCCYAELGIVRPSIERI